MSQYPICDQQWMYDPNVSDGEFWERVFNKGDLSGPDIEDYDPTHDMSVAEMEGLGLLPRVPCPECSQTDACGYDERGRPWVHLVKDHDNE